MINVAILSPDPVDGAGLKSLVKSAKGVRSPTVCRHADALPEIIATVKPSVVVVCHTRGYEPLLASVTPAVKFAPVLVVVTRGMEHRTLSLVAAGVSGVVLWENLAKKLAAAIQCVVNGGMFIDADLASAVQLDLNGKKRSRDNDALSARELSYIRLAGQGKSDQEISTALGVKRLNAAYLRRCVCKKTGVNGTHQLVKYAIEHGIV